MVYAEEFRQDLIDVSQSECIGRKRVRPLNSPLEQTVRAYVTCKVNYMMHRSIGRPTFPDARPANFGARPVSRFPMIIHLNREVASNYVGVRGLIR